jgi:hypothetical protein
VVSTLSGDILYGSSGPLLALAGTAAMLSALFVLDSRIERSIPRSVYGFVGLAGVVWIVSVLVGDSADTVLPVVVGAAVLVGIVAVDQWTSIEIPRVLLAGVGLITGVWVIEAIAPGTIQEPIAAGLGEIAPLVIFGGLATGAYLLLRR